MNAEGLRARCSHCDYVRRFSPELGGKYFRCPKCRQGVLAVPRASAGSQERWRSSADRWLVGEDAPKGAGRPSQADPSETPGVVVAAARAARDVAQATPVGDEESDGGEASSHDTGDGASDPDGADPNHRGEVATVRKIIVECGLCGFLVSIPPAFFGKTVHCPECAGDTVFSESALEPVKDELIDRMALDTAERDALFRIDAARKPAGWTTLRSFLVGVGLGLVAILGVWGVLRAQRSARREATVQAAQREGWRWATDERDPGVLHEPWCRDLVRIDVRVSEDERARRRTLTLHACD